MYSFYKSGLAEVVSWSDVVLVSIKAVSVSKWRNAISIRS